MRSPLLAFLCAGLCFTGASAQQQTPTPPGQPAVTFRAEVDYVDVDTFVTDRQGNFIKGLTKDDFELLEDGKPQKVAMFSYVDLPVERPDRLMFANRPAVNDVKTNQQSLAGRLYVVVLDDLNTSLFRTATVRRTAHRFVEERLSPNDVAAVVYTSGRTDAAQEFTSDRSLLLVAVDKFIGRKLRSAMLDKIDQQYNQAQLNAMNAASRDPNAPPANINSGSESAGASTDPSINPYTRGDGYPDRTYDSDDLERGYRALRVLGELRDMSDFLGNIHGRRKALLLFSEGIDYDTTNIFGAQEATQVIRATQDAITAAARGNVSIFGIDPRGLVGMSADALSLDSPGAPGDAPTASANLAGFSAEIRLSQDSLRSLSEDTGGFAWVNSNDTGLAFDRIVRANSTYYVLGYYPPTHPRDGRFHKIEVRVKRPGLSVVARKGYASPRGKTPEERAKDEAEKLARDAKKGGADTTTAELRAVLNSPMQQGGVTMAVHVAPFKGADKEASVAITIEMDAARFRFEPGTNGTTFNDNVELSYFSMNEQGKPLRGERRQLELSLRADTYKRAQQAGLRLNQRIALAPGRYQLRIGVLESGTGALGTVFYDVLVPDFVKAPLSMSGILMTAGSSQIVPTLVADKVPGPELLPGPATSRRTFAQGDELAIYAEIYDNIPTRQVHSLETVTRLVGEDGRALFTSRETHDAAPSRGAASTSMLSLAKQIPLSDVPPGNYLLQVETTARGGDAKDVKPITRETLLRIVPAPSR